MSEFIVLGLIPGTHLQISFLLWEFAICSVLVFLIARAMHRAQIIQGFVIARVIANEVTRHDIVSL